MTEGEPKHWDNEYFDGKVRSTKTIIDGRRATQGEIDPGEYKFTTDSEEKFTVTGGAAEIKLENETEFRRYNTGEVAVIPPNSTFTIRVAKPVTYDCVYMDPQPPVVRPRYVPDESDTWDGADDDDRDDRRGLDRPQSPNEALADDGDWDNM